MWEFPVYLDAKVNVVLLERWEMLGSKEWKVCLGRLAREV